MENKSIGTYFVEMLGKDISIDELGEILNEEVIKEVVESVLKWKKVGIYSLLLS